MGEKKKIRKGLKEITIHPRPRISNTGAQLEKQPRFLVDWFSFTIPNTISVSDVIGLLQMDAERFVRVERGRLGYKTVHAWGDISILSDGPLHNGIHVQMSGNGCRNFESASLFDAWETWALFLRRIWPYSPHTARLDISMDIYSFDVLKRLREAMERGDFQSRFKSFQSITGGTLQNEKTGDTLYLGKRQSRVMLRVYDKGLEMGTGEAWQRIELELKNERAQVFCEKWLEGAELGELFCGVVLNYLEIKDLWWNELLQTAKKTKLTKAKPKKTLDETAKWFEQHMAGTLATVFEYKGMGDLDYLKDLAILGSCRQNETQRKLLEVERRKGK